MPIYEYECTSCGHRFEKMVKMGADAPPCPECEAAVRKLVSRAGFILQGGGWYKDHYGLKSGGDSSDGSKGSGGTKAPAAKSEPAPAKTESASTTTTTTSTTPTTSAGK